MTDRNIGYLYLYLYTYLVSCLLCGVGSSSLRKNIMLNVGSTTKRLSIFCVCVKLKNFDLVLREFLLGLRVSGLTWTPRLNTSLQFFFQCKPGYAGNGFHCGDDSDADGIPDKALPCSGDVCKAVSLAIVKQFKS